MSKLRFKISMSLDGYVAGPEQSVSNPLGIGGMRLHEWAFRQKHFQRLLGMAETGVDDESTPVIAESVANIGATIMGRHMFGGHPGGWDEANPWMGWWGDDPPFHHPVFVLTHHPRAPLVMRGGTTFHFVTDGIESALAQARAAAGARDVTLAGGAYAAQQYLRAGFVDEMELNVAPVLLGSGERLFDRTGDSMHGMKLVRTVATPHVVHLKFARA
ncbi:MAG TPA: dihydrofolate reductase family protein [Xanthomonadales bacterium]|nr:dihydrofolate reductase family protein [Xanthomonadales bacterium]